jgi:hypothetical protein
LSPCRRRSPLLHPPHDERWQIHQAVLDPVRQQLAHLRSVVGLVWRSVVLWMMLLALLTLANLVG